MRTHVVALLVLCLVGLAASAVPASTAGPAGTIDVTVTAQSAPAPCIDFATPPGTHVGFGTMPFSTLGNVSDRLGDIAPRFSNCSPTATERILISGSDAVGSGVTWTLAPGSGDICPTLNTYRLDYNTDHVGSIPIGKTNFPLENASNGVTTFAPSEAHNLGLELVMPCQGSDGSGLTLSMSVNLTATIA
jgi:hypothetical protein